MLVVPVRATAARQPLFDGIDFEVGEEKATGSYPSSTLGKGKKYAARSEGNHSSCGLGGCHIDGRADGQFTGQRCDAARRQRTAHAWRNDRNPWPLRHLGLVRSP